MSLPATVPHSLIANLGRKGFWPTSIRFRHDGEQLVGTVEAWSRKACKEVEAEPARSMRGVVGQGSFDL